MRKMVSLATALALIALAALLARLWLQRAALAYNSEGRYFDAAEGVVYTDDAVAVYGLMALLVAACAVAAVIWTARAWRR